MQPLFWLGGALGAGYLLVCLWFLINQRDLIFAASRRAEARALEAARAAGLAPWRDAAGTLRGWRIGADAPAERWLLFHGNAGTAVERASFALGLLRGDPAREVLLVEYPGYDFRAGVPSERAILDEAAALVREQAARGAPLFLLGESLGGAVAVLAAAREPERVAGLLLYTPLPDLIAVGGHHYPWLPVRLLVRERFAARAAARGLRIPAYFVLAGDDATIPPKFGEAHYAAYPGPKAVWREPGAAHNTLSDQPGARWWSAAEQFWADQRTQS